VKTLKKLGDALNTDDDKGTIIAVVVALLIIAAVVGGYYLIYRPTPKGYTNMYVLDAQGKAVNYTEILIVNQPTTYNVFVENREGADLQCELQVKVTNQTISQFPINVEPQSTYDETLADGATWEIQPQVTLHETGSYSIIFELWTRNTSSELKFKDALKLSVDAINQG
jgi:uncharacterized membrane protein